MGPLLFGEMHQNPQTVLLVPPSQEYRAVAMPGWGGWLGNVAFDFMVPCPWVLLLNEELQGMGGTCCLKSTHAHQLLFHLAKAGPEQVGGMHAGQAQDETAPK